MTSATRTSLFIGALALQVVIVLGIVLMKTAVITGGTTVLLYIEPVDPRDPLRGDYVTFQYSISSIPIGMDPGIYSPNGEEVVYVSLDTSSKYAEMTDVSASPPRRGLYLKGRLYWGEGFRNQRIVYGLEEYFIPEGVGRNFSFWNHDVAAEVVIDDAGNGVLRRLFVDDQPWP